MITTGLEYPSVINRDRVGAEMLDSYRDFLMPNPPNTSVSVNNSSLPNASDLSLTGTIGKRSPMPGSPGADFIETVIAGYEFADSCEPGMSQTGKVCGYCRGSAIQIIRVTVPYRSD